MIQEDTPAVTSSLRLARMAAVAVIDFGVLAATFLLLGTAEESSR